MKVAILGAGPSAAYAVKACDALKVECEVFSNTLPPTFYPGAFWPRVNPLEKDMPLYNIYISKIGTALEYLKKQWGCVEPEWLEETSFPTESRHELGLNPYELFGEIWKDKEVQSCHKLTDVDIERFADHYDALFMTFPTQRSKEIFKHELITYPVITYKDDLKFSNYCIYDGEVYDEMTRMSNLFGYVHTEYSQHFVPSQNLIGTGKVTWVQDTLPDTPEWELDDKPADNVYLIGRHAQWSRKKLAHHAFDDVIAILDGDN